jgi:CubicO group peptidase (beta-lactamase class C family)
VPAHRPITLRDLLTFRRGFGIVMAPPGTYPIQKAMSEQLLGQGPPSPSTPPAPDEWIRRLGTLPLMHQPGEKWMYNTGSDVLGVLIARASGQALETFLRERIFEPLGMKDTSFSVPATKLDRLATSYWSNPQNGALELYDEAEGGQWSRPPAFPSGAGGLVSTIDERFEGMGRFGGLGSGGPEAARSEAHKASTSARTGAGGRMRPVWRRYTRKRSRASSRSLSWGQRVARSAGSVRVVSTSSCLGESIMNPSLSCIRAPSPAPGIPTQRSPSECLSALPSAPREARHQADSGRPAPESPADLPIGENCG